MEKNSLWISTTSQPSLPEFPGGKLNVDVAIVGGGISGLTAAILLKRAGRTVAVIEKSQIATGESGYTTAHVTEVLDTDYAQLIKDYGLTGARSAAQSSRAAIDMIDALTHEFEIDCDFTYVSGYKYTDISKDIPQLESELSAARKAGLKVDITNTLPPEFRALAALHFPDQARFHPRKYMLGLARQIEGAGSHIFVNTRVRGVNDGKPCTVVTDRGEIQAQDVFVMTNTPINNRVFLHTKLAAYRTYAVAAPLNAPLPDGLYWDTFDPYHYIRTQNVDGLGDMLIVGGEDHKTGTIEDTEPCFERLIQYVNERFDVGEISHRWSGQIMEPVDGLPYIGKNSLSNHVYVATGYSGNGMTFGTLAGMILSDAVLGLENPWAKLYDATRIKPIAALPDYVSENKDFPSYFILDRLSKADADSIAAVQRGEGMMISIDGKKTAVSRDENGEIHACSPVCPHLGCYVHWNSGEQTWDCPCHGSRFSATGEVANGPAVDDLPKVEIPQPHAAASGPPTFENEGDG